MRKFVFALAVIFILLCTNVSAQEVTVFVNNNPITSPVPARIINDRTMLPMRAIFERLGADVNWVEEEKMIVATREDLLIVMKIGDSIMTVQRTSSNELTAVELDSPPFIENGSTLVPVRAVAESLGAEVGWNGDTYTVTINTEGKNI